MTLNPYYNAIFALGYVTLVVSLMRLGAYFGAPDTPDNVLIPIGMLSLFVLSATAMAYIFFYQPVMLFLDGKREDAVRLFVRTVAVFAVLTLSVLTIAVSLS
jgi:hypothetical protein